MKSYKSMEELERHVKILRLKADINKQKADINYKYLKHNLRPTKLLGDFVATVCQKQFLFYVLRKITKKLRIS